MSLYNMIFGKSPSTKEILALLGLEECQIERFRDCFVEGDKIVIFTRTGGGNREYYPNEALINHPSYLYDADDDYDPTYAYYFFSLPEPPKEREEEIIDVFARGMYQVLQDNGKRLFDIADRNTIEEK